MVLLSPSVDILLRDNQKIIIYLALHANCCHILQTYNSVHLQRKRANIIKIVFKLF